MLLYGKRKTTLVVFDIKAVIQLNEYMKPYEYQTSDDLETQYTTPDTGTTMFFK